MAEEVEGVVGEVSRGSAGVLAGGRRSGQPYVLVETLSEQCMAEDVLAPGSSGACSDIFLQCFQMKAGQRVVNSPSLGAMGTGLPGAIGNLSGKRQTTDHLRQRRRRISTEHPGTGDGAATAIFPSSTSSGAMGHTRRSSPRSATTSRDILVGSDPSSHLTLPDLNKVAAAYGIHTMEIRAETNIREQVAAVLAYDGWSARFTCRRIRRPCRAQPLPRGPMERS